MAAVIVAGLMAGRSGVDDLLQALFRSVNRSAWHLFVVALQILLSGLALLLAIVTGASQDVAIDWAALPVVTLSLLFMLTLWEELGLSRFRPA